MIRDDLQAQVEVLTNLGKKYSDAGPVFDCVVFNDGEVWRYALTCLMEGSRDSCLPHDFHNILWTVILLLTVQISRVDYLCLVSHVHIQPWPATVGHPSMPVQPWSATVDHPSVHIQPWSATVGHPSMPVCPGQPLLAIQVCTSALVSHCWPSKCACPALVSHSCAHLFCLHQLQEWCTMQISV